MSVAVSCNLSEGVILGVDSAITVPAVGGRVAKVYEDAEKLYQFGERPIGIAAFGLGSIEARSIGSYLREFEVQRGKDVVSAKNTIEDIAKALRDFFMDNYLSKIVPPIEKNLGKKFKDIPVKSLPGFGLVIGGFSADAYLSEVWMVHIPGEKKAGQAKQLRAQGHFGTNWIAMFEPIRRYVKGYDDGLLRELMAYFKGLRGSPFSTAEQKQIQNIVKKYEYPIPFQAMPMQKGIEHTRFLVELVINRYLFGVGAPIVGGRVKIGKVSYRGEKFQILDV